ncbi:MAG: hypothetical protein ACRCR2_00405 [Fusobacteriaceae bacterium]
MDTHGVKETKTNKEINTGGWSDVKIEMNGWMDDWVNGEVPGDRWRDGEAKIYEELNIYGLSDRMMVGCMDGCIVV